MRAVVQRVSSAAVSVADGDVMREIGRIATGLLVLLGVQQGDGAEDVRYVAGKVCDLRIFADPDASDHRMTRSVLDLAGEVLVVSQFTLAGDCRRGRRPSFDDAAAPDLARPLYESVVHELQGAGLRVVTGEFQAMMQVSLVNDGPVTLLLDSRKRF
jgi:D-tyrosyl-tRNA(Tyr) deacylase